MCSILGLWGLDPKTLRMHVECFIPDFRVLFAIDDLDIGDDLLHRWGQRWGLIATQDVEGEH